MIKHKQYFPEKRNVITIIIPEKQNHIIFSDKENKESFSRIKWSFKESYLNLDMSRNNYFHEKNEITKTLVLMI